MSSFKSKDPFGSGPHRFRVLPLGQLVVSEFASSGTGSGSRYEGLLELVVEVEGRLSATTEAGLWALRDAVAAELLDPPEPGTLVDEHGRSWEGMSFVRLEAGARTDRGRVRSVSYTARFMRFATYPQS